MLSRLAALVGALLLLGATAAFAAPPARDEGDDLATIVLSQTVPPLFLSAAVQPAVLPQFDARDLANF